ncbi:MAG: peptidase S24 [Bacteroidetes bacterium MED-G13]|nr:MAG: peptidase S24 [Bacteroidetes bacterium MED-G13]
MKKKNTLNFFTPSHGRLEAILINAGISAGFPSPAGDFKQERISLDKELIKNKEATFFARVSGESMINAGLEDGDLIVIDRSLEPTNNKIAVCFIDGEFTVKRLQVKKNKIWLKPENTNYKAIEVKEDNELIIWGIVTNVIKKL